jgi:hypothetical protein
MAVAECIEILRRFEAEYPRRTALSDTERASLNCHLDEAMRLIANFGSFEKVDGQLKKLCEIQEVMAALAFKHGIELSSRQREIVREYDRCDDEAVRRDTFQKIKNATFPWRIAE